MVTLNLELLAEHLLQQRAGRGQRAVAKEIGVSASTLCRVETGYAPDLESFSKMCRWLGAEPSVYLGLAMPEPNLIRVQLDVIFDVPGERVSPLMNVPLADALALGLRVMGLRPKPASGAYRKLTSIGPGEPIPRHLREREST